MGIPRSAELIVTQQLLDQYGPDLYERFVQLAEKYQYRDLGRAAADAIRVWVETHERPDTGRPPENPDATIQAPPPVIDDLERDPSAGDK